MESIFHYSLLGGESAVVTAVSEQCFRIRIQKEGDPESALQPLFHYTRTRGDIPPQGRRGSGCAYPDYGKSETPLSKERWQPDAL